MCARKEGIDNQNDNVASPLKTAHVDVRRNCTRLGNALDVLIIEVNGCGLPLCLTA